MYVKGNGHIYASLVGRLQITKQETNKGASDNNDHDTTETADTTNNNSNEEPSYTCSVRACSSSTAIGASEQLLPATSQVLQIGQIVIGKVLRITPQNAIVDIRVAEYVGALQPNAYYEGAIRMEDIRAGASEQIHLPDCFRPGDLVACRIISLGDSRRYFLSTAETELGVIRAMNDKGQAMIPISWKEMECPQTGIKEPRKCAKPIALHHP
jgi:exosome complex component CSL4